MLLIDQLKRAKNFTYAERTIAKYILSNPKRVLDLTVDAMASEVFASSASIVRLCKKLGFKGYMEFKVRLAIELHNFDLDDERVPPEIPFNKNSSVDDIIKKLLNLEYQALKDTYNNLDPIQIERIAKQILQCSSFSIYGIGESHLLSADFYFKIMRLKPNVFCESIPGTMANRARRLEEGSLAFMISYYGENNENLVVAKNLKVNKIPIILLTGPEINPLCQYASERIHIPVREERMKIGTLASNQAMQFALNCIYSAAFMQDYDGYTSKMQCNDRIKNEARRL